MPTNLRQTMNTQESPYGDFQFLVDNALRVAQATKVSQAMQQAASQVAPPVAPQMSLSDIQNFPPPDNTSAGAVGIADFSGVAKNLVKRAEELKGDPVRLEALNMFIQGNPRAKQALSSTFDPAYISSVFSPTLAETPESQVKTGINKAAVDQAIDSSPVGESLFVMKKLRTPANEKLAGEYQSLYTSLMADRFGKKEKIPTSAGDVEIPDAKISLKDSLADNNTSRANRAGQEPPEIKLLANYHAAKLSELPQRTEDKIKLREQQMALAFVTGRLPAFSDIPAGATLDTPRIIPGKKAKYRQTDEAGNLVVPTERELKALGKSASDFADTPDTQSGETWGQYFMKILQNSPLHDGQPSPYYIAYKPVIDNHFSPTPQVVKPVVVKKWSDRILERAGLQRISK